MYDTSVCIFLGMYLAMNKVKNKKYCAASERHIEEHGYRCGDIIHKSGNIDAKSVAEDGKWKNHYCFTGKLMYMGL